MVLPNSRKISRVPRYLGALQGSLAHFAYGAITLYGGPFQVLRLYTKFVTPRRIRNCVQQGPTTPDIQRFRAITYIRFGLFPFRSPLLWESLLLSSPEVT